MYMTMNQLNLLHCTGDGKALPHMEYIAFMFHINKARNSWVWHFNVTKDLNALIQVRTACRNVNSLNFLYF